jgi:transcription elongation GreA/GreB family factor
MPDAYNWDNGLVLNLPTFPKTTADYQELLDAGEYSKLEDMLIARLDIAPNDISFYLPAYRVFFKKQDMNRASAIYGLQIESLKARKDLASEILLLQAILGLSEECSFTRDHLLHHLKSMYSDSPNFDLYVSHLRLLDGVAGIEKFRQLELWLRYDEGRVVYLPSKGIARVKEANPKFGVIRIIIIKNNEQLSLRIDEAERLTQSLSASHFLARTLNDKDALIKTAQSDPGELLRMLFSSLRREVALNDLREMLAGIVPDPQWSAWWARARKDPHLVVGSGTKSKLNWNDSVADGNAALMTKFLQANAYAKLEMFEKHAARSKTLAAEMAQTLIAESTKLRASDPSLALEIALSIEESPQGKALEQSLSARDFLSREGLETTDVAKTVAGIKDRLARKTAMTFVAQSRDDWPQIYLSLLSSETDTSLFKLIYETLRTKAQDTLLDSEIEKAVSDPSSLPRFYLWLSKEMSGRPELLKRANWDFLRSLFDILDHPAFKGHYPALRKLFDPGEIVDRVIETLDIATGRSLLDALSRDRELEDYRKEDVRRKLFIHFPELQEKKQDLLFVTKEALENKRIEFEKLIKEEIPHNTKEIQRTREFGDLRENFEYHAARRKQELLSSRAKAIHDELIITRVIEPATVDTSKISIGTRFCLRPAAGIGESITLTILGPWDSDPSNNVLSYTSAAGAALLNVAPGSSVIFNEGNYIVDNIALWNS